MIIELSGNGIVIVDTQQPQIISGLMVLIDAE